MSLVPGDFGSMVRAQQSAQADRDQANQAVQNMRNRFANMGPGMTQIPTSGPYAGGYGQPFARQAPMMDMRGIGGLLAGLVRGFGGGFGGGYPPPSAYMRERGQTQELRPSDVPPPPSMQQQQQAAAAIAAGANPAARLGGTIGDSRYSPQGPQYGQLPTITSTGAPMGNEFPQPPPFQGGFGQPQRGFQQFQPQGGFGQPQGGFGQPPMGGAPGGKGGAKGGGTFGQPSYGAQARYSSPFGNLF